ncbi:hypothetical protein Hanom_Chr10g00894461 [Helianthus anomalus]
MFQASIVEFDSSHNTCCVLFKDILEFMKRLPIQQALTNHRSVFRSHIDHF